MEYVEHWVTYSRVAKFIQYSGLEKLAISPWLVTLLHICGVIPTLQSLETLCRYRRELCTDIAKNSARAPMSPCQSAEYDKRVDNISLFIYIGSPGLHRNSHQVPGSSCHSALASHHFAYIYNIYRLPVHNFIFSIKCTSLFFDIFWRQMSDQSPRDVGTHPINFLSTIHYKLRHDGQQYFWIKLN